MFEIPPRSLDDMEQSLRFRLPSVRVRLSRRMAEISAVLRLSSDEEFPISGFPRALFKDDMPEDSEMHASLLTENIALTVLQEKTGGSPLQRLNHGKRQTRPR